MARKSKIKTITFAVNENGCHICTSHHLNRDGYATIYKAGRTQNLHRVLYEEKFGPLGELVARHKCDTPTCINLKHIEPGTWSDNREDVRKRNRYNPPYGERSGTSKLTEEQIRCIRNEIGTHQYLADKYSVNQSTITRIKSRKRWAHLE